ncbi:MAG: flagellar hook-associated protein FlgK [Alphaproteobacteria bacterium]|nr:flagellar hook-associated protein FlgK [Alphaproteobacteria bacterium]
MSLISAVDNATSSLRAIQADMQIVSGNVSNAGVDGYTKKSINLSADTNGTNGAGGVLVTGYSRATSDVISKLLNQALSDNGLHGTQKEYLSRIQDLLGSNQSNPALSQTLSDFSAAWKNFATSPEDGTAKLNIVFKAQNLTREISTLADGLDKINSDANLDLSAAVTTLNNSLNRVHELNNEISSALASGQSSGDLEDLRDKEVQTISSLTKINVVQRAGGRIAIFTPGGSSMLDAAPNQYAWNGIDITQTSSGSIVTNILTGGKLEALVGILDQGSSATTLNDPGKASTYKIQQQLDKIVDLLANPANSFAIAYDSATTLAGEQAASFFTGATRYNFALNASIANNTTTVKKAAAVPVSNDLSLETRSISAGNLSTTNVSYTTFANAVIAKQNQSTSQVNDQATVYATQKDYYSKRLKDETGVNVDEEIVKLTQLQNNYSASARVISVVKQMYDIIDGIVR